MREEAQGVCVTGLTKVRTGQLITTLARSRELVHESYIDDIDCGTFAVFDQAELVGALTPVDCDIGFGLWVELRGGGGDQRSRCCQNI